MARRLFDTLRGTMSRICSSTEWRFSLARKQKHDILRTLVFIVATLLAFFDIAGAMFIRFITKAKSHKSHCNRRLILVHPSNRSRAPPGAMVLGARLKPKKFLFNDRY